MKLRVLESSLTFLMKHLAYYLYVKTEILVDFHICISVPLTLSE